MTENSRPLFAPLAAFLLAILLVGQGCALPGRLAAASGERIAGPKTRGPSPRSLSRVKDDGGAAFVPGVGGPGVGDPGVGDPSVGGLDAEATLPDLLAHAARHNPGLEAAFNRWRAAMERAAGAGTLPDPRFSFAVFLEEVETRVGPQRRKYGLSQTFPWFGKLGARKDVAARGADAKWEKFRKTELELFREVKNAWFEYVYLARALAITEENLSLLNDLESVARARFKVGAAPYASVLRAQVELGVLEDRLRSLQDLRGPVAAELNAALGRRPDDPLPGVGKSQDVSLPFEERELWRRLIANNPDLLALEHTVAAENAGLDLARRGSWPDFTLGLDYIETGGARMAGVRDSGKDPLIASLSLNIPFFSGKYAAAEREAERRHHAAIRDLADRRNRLAAALKRALFDFRDADRKTGLYRQTLLPRASQALEVTLQAFEAGGADFLDLVDAQRILLAFRLDLERAVADRAQALAALEALVGGELSSPADAADADVADDEPNTVSPVRKGSEER
jgi:outer membrane protein, heavy metal efflux system